MKILATFILALIIAILCLKLYNSLREEHKVFESFLGKVEIIKLILLIIVYAFCIYLAWGLNIDRNMKHAINNIYNKFVTEKLSWLYIREKDSLYLDGNIIAKTSEPSIDFKNKTIYFSEIVRLDTQKVNIFQIHNLIFEYREYRLKFIGDVNYTWLNFQRPNTPSILSGAKFKIIERQNNDPGTSSLAE